MARKTTLDALRERLMAEGMNAVARASSAAVQSFSRDLRKVAETGSQAIAEIDRRLRSFENEIASPKDGSHVAESSSEDERGNGTVRPRKKRKRKK